MKRPNLNRQNDCVNKKKSAHLQDEEPINIQEKSDNSELKINSKLQYLRNKININKELKEKAYNQNKTEKIEENTENKNLNNAPKISKTAFLKNIRKIQRPTLNEETDKTNSQQSKESFERRSRVRRTQNNNSSPKNQKSTRKFISFKDTSFKVTQKGSSNLMLTVVAVMLVLGACLVFMAPTLQAWMAQSKEYQQLENQIAQTQKQNEELKKKLEELKEPSYIADQARQRLGYVRKGETTYVVVDPETIKEQKNEAENNQTAPRKPWFNLIQDSIKVIEEGKNKPAEKETKKPAEEETKTN